MKKIHTMQKIVSLLMLIITSSLLAAELSNDAKIAIKNHLMNIKKASFNTAINQCQEGHALSCSIAISSYRTGEGVDKDENKANELYETSLTMFQNQCEKDKFKGCYELGNFVNEKSLKLKYYEISCDQGNKHACGAMDEAFEWGGSIEKFYPLEKSVYKKSCQEGKLSACVIFNLLDENY